MLGCSLPACPENRKRWHRISENIRDSAEYWGSMELIWCILSTGGTARDCAGIFLVLRMLSAEASRTERC